MPEIRLGKLKEKVLRGLNCGKDVRGIKKFGLNLHASGHKIVEFSHPEGS